MLSRSSVRFKLCVTKSVKIMFSNTYNIIYVRVKFDIHKIKQLLFLEKPILWKICTTVKNLCFQWNQGYGIVENVADVFCEVYFITTKSIWVAKKVFE